eukprot:PhM_4_TR15583/c0_g1_i1/m.16893
MSNDASVRGGGGEDSFRQALQSITSNDQRLLQEIESVHRLIRTKHEQLEQLAKGTEKENSTASLLSSKKDAEYRADIESLAKKLALARAECQKKDGIIQELNTRLNKQKPVCVDAGVQMASSVSHGDENEHEKNDDPALLRRLQHTVVQVFELVTGESSHHISEFNAAQCAEIISARVDNIVKKIERLLNFRHEVVEFCVKRVVPPTATSDESAHDPLQVWRRGRAKVLEALEANRALQSEVEELNQRLDAIPQRPTGWTREVSSSYDNVRQAFGLSVRHTQWHRQHTRRGEESEYHDMCEITRRLEEVQGRLHWVVLNCLEDAERGPDGLLPPVNKDDIIASIGPVRSSTSYRSPSRTPIGGKSPVRAAPLDRSNVVCSAAPRVARPSSTQRSSSNLRGSGASPMNTTNLNTSSSRPRSPVASYTRTPTPRDTTRHVPPPPSPRSPTAHTPTKSRVGAAAALRTELMREFQFMDQSQQQQRVSAGGARQVRSPSPNGSAMGLARGRSTSTSPARVVTSSAPRVSTPSYQRMSSSTLNQSRWR